ncbi:MAG: hypothetical protein OEQ28_05390 [Acidobacteriota bacterium]|nr:hypothetical protein [Acidobacteriota bacterium]
MIIDVIDMVDGAGKYQKEDLIRMGYKHFVELTLMSNGLMEMKNRIIKTAVSQSIKVLRIWGHGGPGVQNVSLGTCDPGNKEHGMSAITINNLNNLIQLGPYFAPNARAELRGCSVANDKGRMMSALARLWQVRVQATTLDKLEGHLFWDKIVEARPGVKTLFPVNPIPLSLRR